nr:CoA ester lyase [Nocardioides panaciterrulae]
MFVPGSRPDRFARAAGSGADEVIVDLEDAVAAEAKSAARDRVASWLGGPGSGWVRINGAGTPWHESDLAAIGGRDGLRGVVVPKAEDPVSLRAVREALPEGVPVLALVETALGIHLATELACSGAVDRLAFGAIDFALDIGAEESDEALLFARSALVVASRVGSLPPPVDGVTVSTTVDSESHRAAARAQGLGFGGKLCIHPRQVRPVAEGFQPTPAQIAWATRVLQATSGDAAGATGQGAVSVDGHMVDRPVILRAQSIVARARSGSAG